MLPHYREIMSVWTLIRKGHFCPSGCLYGTRFDSKVYILARHYWIGITDPFLGYWGPFGGPKRAILWANWSPLWPPIVTNPTFWPLKRSSDGPKWPEVGTWYLLWSMTHFWTIGAHLGALKRPFYEQISPFGTPQMAEIPYKASKMHCTFGDHPDGASSDIWDQIWLIWAIWWSFQGPKGWICDYWGPQRGSVCS